MKKKIKTAKWIIGIATVILIIIGLLSKIFQIIYLKEISWDMMSFSPLSIFLIFVGSVLFLTVAMLDRAIHKNKFSIRNPGQMFFLIGGVSGLIYATLIVVLKLKSMAVI